MPCRSEHMEPNAREFESVRVMGFLYEVGVLDSRPSLYGDTEKLDEHTAQLCAWCYSNNVKYRSLELQIWWRDHKAADKARIEREISASKNRRDRMAALNKLTDHEKTLLGIK